MELEKEVYGFGTSGECNREIRMKRKEGRKKGRKKETCEEYSLSLDSPHGEAMDVYAGHVGSDGNRKLVRKSRRGGAVLEDKPMPHKPIGGAWLFISKEKQEHHGLLRL